MSWPQDALRVWAERVRANREQVDRLREVPDGADFYAPVASQFRADPCRTDEPALDHLRALVQSGDTWLDIGAGGGRYALPLALLAREVIALDPSPAMLDVLREGMREHGISNVRPLEDRWPMAVPPRADASLASHVGYDIEDIGPFLEAMEAATKRLCVVVMMAGAPSSAFDPLWPLVHGETRAALPALRGFVELQRARGFEAEVRLSPRMGPTYASPADVLPMARRLLWVREGSPRDEKLQQALAGWMQQTTDGYRLPSAGWQVGVATWAPHGRAPSNR